MGAQNKIIKSIDPAFYLLLPILVLLIVFMIIPVFRIFVLSFFDPDFTVKHYLKFYKVGVYSQILLRTLTISLMVSICCLIVGYPVAYLMADVPARTTKVLLIFVVLPMWTGILVRTYAWMVLLGRKGILNKMLIYFDVIAEPLKVLYTTKAVVLAMVQILVPLMILPLYATMKGIDRNLLKASKVLGAGPLRSFWHVFLPLSTPGILAGFTLVFILSMAFFITPALVGGRKDIMIAMLIESQVTRLLNWGFAAALSLILMAMTLVIILVFNKFIGIDRFLGSAES
ncbi:MAG: ABC transporter permease [bacterium]|nr:ABC transporter permease [bacterium]